MDSTFPGPDEPEETSRQGLKTFLEFTADEGADAHCQVGAERLALARIYNWLDDTLDAPVSPRRHGLAHPDQEGQRR